MCIYECLTLAVVAGEPSEKLMRATEDLLPNLLLLLFPVLFLLLLLLLREPPPPLTPSPGGGGGVADSPPAVVAAVVVVGCKTRLDMNIDTHTQCYTHTYMSSGLQDDMHIHT